MKTMIPTIAFACLTGIGCDRNKAVNSSADAPTDLATFPAFYKSYCDRAKEIDYGGKMTPESKRQYDLLHEEYDKVRLEKYPEGHAAYLVEYLWSVHLTEAKNGRPNTRNAHEDGIAVQVYTGPPDVKVPDVKLVCWTPNREIVTTVLPCPYSADLIDFLKDQPFELKKQYKNRYKVKVTGEIWWRDSNGNTMLATRMTDCFRQPYLKLERVELLETEKVE